VNADKIYIMLSRFFKVVAFISLIASLSACVGNAGGRVTQDLSRLERDIADIRAFQAEQTTQIARTESNLRSLVGRLEELEHSRAGSRGGQQVEALQRNIEELRKRVPPPKIVPVEALEMDEQMTISMSPQAQPVFSDALLMLRQGQFSRSVALLEEALDANAGHTSSANILFWLGVSHDGLEDHRRAVSAYHDMVSRFPQHQRAPLALLRQADVFNRLGDRSAARLTLQKIEAEFPRSPEAAIARSRL